MAKNNQKSWTTLKVISMLSYNSLQEIFACIQNADEVHQAETIDARNG